MLRVQRSLGNNIHIAAEGTTTLEVFERLSRLNETFGDAECGKCKGTKLRYQIRKAKRGNKTFDYPEIVCQNPKCRAKLSFSKTDTEEGITIYPSRYAKRKNEDGEYEDIIEDGKKKQRGTWGWTKYNPETKQEE